MKMIKGYYIEWIENGEVKRAQYTDISGCYGKAVWAKSKGFDVLGIWELYF